MSFTNSLTNQRLRLAGALITPSSLLRLLRPRDCVDGLVRVGSEGDGGYLIPNDLEGVDGVFSPGVADTADFERHFADKGVPCFLIDGSVDGPPFPHPHIEFERIWLGSKTTDTTISMSDWLNEKAPNADQLVLQMDIENAEYEILKHMSIKTLRRFRIIVIEFHLLSNKILKTHQRPDLKKILTKLKKTHVPVHFHPNNCCGQTRIGRWNIPQVAEVSFIRIDRKQHLKTYSLLPSKHDQNNTTNPYQPTPWD